MALAEANYLFNERTSFHYVGTT